ncbi:MAG: Xaa-Pro peptidase family protein [Clostridia bacterium]|nr:Xaa-Pro peptidase family protein [Clostridia bacterium]
MNYKIRALREKLKSLNLEGMIVTNPVNIKYLTNIDAKTQGILLITRKENIFLTYTMYIEDVNKTLTIDDEIIVADMRDISNEEAENFFVFCENIGFEENHVTYEQYKRLKQKYRINNMVETEKIIEKQRMIKDEEEIQKIKKACQITDDCFKHLLGYIKEGMTEKEVALEIEIFFKTHGAEDVSFSPIVAFGENSAYPHWVPGDRKVQMADPILIDMGCKYKGYCSDMTRTIFMGCILEDIKPVYNLVLKNQEYVLEEMRSNYNIKTISRSVEDSFKLNNHTLIHGLGHGVGLEVHEIPGINQKNESFLKENMVITNEPGIYLPGKYGIRIEDTVLITKQGCIKLTNSSKEYIVI